MKGVWYEQAKSIFVDWCFLIVVGMAFLVFPDWRKMFFQLFQLENLEQMQEWVNTVGACDPIVLIALMVVHSVTFIPSEIIMIANFVLFVLS